jgi:gluconokinase
VTARPALLVCMGVSGCGKSTVARAIADATGVEFLEGDDFHSAEARARMAAGLPLDDAMRAPWIERICAALDAERARGRDAVLACSALRRRHRQRLREAGFRTRFLFLDGPRERIAGWLRERPDHFMPPGLLDSQFEALESPAGEADVVRVPLGADRAALLARALDEARRFLAAGR